MVQIKALGDIDKAKLKSLFQKRGHAILTPDFLGFVKEILEGKRKGMEVHQCGCGELMVLSKAHANSLRRKYRTDDIPCKVCGKREKQILSMKIFERFREITNFLNERYVFTTKSLSTLKPEDVKILEKMALGLFPTNTHAEMLVGYFDFMSALARHFPKRIFKSKDTIKRFFDEAKTNNQKEFERMYYSLLDWEKSHKAELNLFSKEDIMSSLLSKDFSRSLEEDLIEKEKLDVETARIQLELSAYQDAIEIKVYLDILANVLNIINGKRISADPFRTLRLPPLKRTDKAREIKSLADKVEYLKSKLPFNITKMYNTHLRNAIAHNEYQIDGKERKIVLTRYSETLTFDEFKATFHALKDLHYAINSYLADYHIEKTRLKVRNQGIGALIIGYTDFFEEQGKLHPKAPCDAQLNIYQYWDFATYEERQRVFPMFEIRTEERDQTLVVDFGENGALYRFPKSPELVEWLEQLIVTGCLHITLSTIAPTLPIFAQKAIMRVPIGKVMDVYILDASEKKTTVSHELIKDVIKFLRK